MSEDRKKAPTSKFKVAHDKQKEQREELVKRFNHLVNMSATEIENFLNTDNSKKVGQKKDGSKESIGHQSGRHIIRILRKDKSELTPDDFAHMRKVCSYIARHTAQGGPAANRESSAWRYSLMNWGHDPLKK